LWECDPNRMIIEHKALEVYARLVPQCVPAPVFYDADNYIMCRQAAPEECPMWKTQLLEGVLDFRIAQKSIETIVTVHNKTAADEEIRTTFGATDIFYSLRINPYIEFTVAKYPEFKKTADMVNQMLLNEKIALVHGDYSPKNILVSGENIFVLDMEVAHFGHPAFDLAFFLNHFLLKSIKNKMWSGAYLTMLSYMVNIYLNTITCINAQEMETLTVRTLAFLFLARVDGKSPAEYITAEKDKNLIRKIARVILKENLKSFEEVISLVKAELNARN
ncbi:MAG: phosphotransferase, partial [Spirochaetales bacterium]|nr:phosphotransferase [Spirochaetales bacterium]